MQRVVDWLFWLLFTASSWKKKTMVEMTVPAQTDGNDTWTHVEWTLVFFCLHVGRNPRGLASDDVIKVWSAGWEHLGLGHHQHPVVRRQQHPDLQPQHGRGAHDHTPLLKLIYVFICSQSRFLLRLYFIIFRRLTMLPKTNLVAVILLGAAVCLQNYWLIREKLCH